MELQSRKMTTSGFKAELRLAWLLSISLLYKYQPRTLSWDRWKVTLRDVFELKEQP